MSASVAVTGSPTFSPAAVFSATERLTAAGSNTGALLAGDGGGVGDGGDAAGAGGEGGGVVAGGVLDGNRVVAGGGVGVGDGDGLAAANRGLGPQGDAGQVKAAVDDAYIDARQEGHGNRVDGDREGASEDRDGGVEMLVENERDVDPAGVDLGADERGADEVGGGVVGDGGDAAGAGGEVGGVVAGGVLDGVRVVAGGGVGVGDGDGLAAANRGLGPQGDAGQVKAAVDDAYIDARQEGHGNRVDGDREGAREDRDAPESRSSSKMSAMLIPLAVTSALSSAGGVVSTVWAAAGAAARTASRARAALARAGNLGVRRGGAVGVPGRAWGLSLPGRWVGLPGRNPSSSPPRCARRSRTSSISPRHSLQCVSTAPVCCHAIEPAVRAASDGGAAGSPPPASGACVVVVWVIASGPSGAWQSA